MKINNVIAITTGLLSAIFLNAMDNKPKNSGIPKISDFGLSTLSVHRSDMLQFEKDELAGRTHQRDYQLSVKTPYYHKHNFDRYIARESFPEVLLMLTRVPELSNGDPLARDLQKVYNGSSDHIMYDPIKYRNIPIWSFANTARWLAEQSGNYAFLENYQNRWDPMYELPSSGTATFSSTSSSCSSSSWSDD